MALILLVAISIAPASAIGSTPGDATFPTTPILDNFDRADGDLGSNWAGPLWAWDDQGSVSSNQYAPSSSAGNGYWSGRTFGNTEVYATVANLNQHVELLARIQDPSSDDFSAYELLGGTWGGVRLFRIDDNDGTVLADNDDANLQAGDQLGLRVVGDQLQAYINGELVLSTTDGTYQSGYIGLAFYGDSGTGGRVDDFGGGDATFPTTPILDNFDRADGALGSNWSGPLWSWDDQGVVSSNEYAPSSSAGNGYWNARSYADTEVYATVANLNQHVELLARIQDPDSDDFSAYELLGGTWGGVRMFRIDNNDGTVLADNDDANLQAGDQLGLRIVGDKLKAYVNGEPVLATTDDTYQSGYSGVAFYGDSGTGGRIDDFGGGVPDDGGPTIQTSGDVKDPNRPGVNLHLELDDDDLPSVASGVKTIKVYIDDQVVYSDDLPCGPSSDSCPAAQTRDLQLPYAQVVGTHTYRVEATDLAGNPATPVQWTETTPEEGTITTDSRTASDTDCSQGLDRDQSEFRTNNPHVLRGTFKCDVIRVRQAGPAITKIIGRGGSDIIYAGHFATTVKAGPGNDVVFGSRGNDRLFGDGGTDRLYGGVGDDSLSGQSDDDLLVGGMGADTLRGQSGADTLMPGATADKTVDGGGDAGDTLSYADAATPGFEDNADGYTVSSFPASDWANGQFGERGVYVNLDAGTANNGDSVRYGGGPDVHVTGFENVIGSPFSDVIIGSGTANRIDAGGGADVVHAQGGNDTIYGGAGGDYLDGGEVGSNTIYGGSGSNSCVRGNHGSPDTCARTDADVVGRSTSQMTVGFMEPSDSNSPQELFLVGSSGNDRVTATYSASSPNTVHFAVHGGPGFDTSEASASGCSSINATSADCSLPTGDQLLSTMVISGGAGADHLSAQGFPKATTVVVLGGEGGDTINGAKNSEDLLVDGPGDVRDVLAGVDSDNVLIHNQGDDALKGGDGNDLLLAVGLCDDASYRGGDGDNSVSWAKAGNGVFASLTSGDAGQNDGGSISCPGATQPDSLQNIQDLEGSPENDFLIGDAGANHLLGRGSPDHLRGMDGSDNLLANNGDVDPEIDCGADTDHAKIDYPNSDGDPGMPNDDTMNCDQNVSRAGPTNVKRPNENQEIADAEPVPSDIEMIGNADGDGVSPSAFYRLDEASGSTVADSSGAEQDGTYHGYNSQPGPTLGVDGAIPDSGGTAIHLDGQNDYLDLGPNVDPGATNASGYSVEMWVKFDEPPSGVQYLLSRSSGDDGVFLYRTDDGHVSFKATNAASQPTVSSDDEVSEDVWHHIVGTLEANTITLYVDGFAYPLGYGQSVAPGAAPNATTLVGVNDDWTGWLSADVDDVSTYDRALAADEVQDHLTISEAQEPDTVLSPEADTSDSDSDGVSDSVDNCQQTANANQDDEDEDGIGDACDTSGDSDGDGVLDGPDNCPTMYNDDQADADSDGVGDVCDPVP